MSIWSYATGWAEFTSNVVTSTTVKNRFIIQKNMLLEESITNIFTKILNDEKYEFQYGETAKIEDVVKRGTLDHTDCSLNWKLCEFNQSWQSELRTDAETKTEYWVNYNTVSSFRLFFSITHRGGEFGDVTRMMKRIVYKLSKCGIELYSYHVMIDGYPYEETFIVDSSLGIIKIQDGRTPARFKNFLC